MSVVKYLVGIIEGPPKNEKQCKQCGQPLQAIRDTTLGFSPMTNLYCANEACSLQNVLQRVIVANR